MEDRKKAKAVVTSQYSHTHVNLHIHAHTDIDAYMHTHMQKYFHMYTNTYALTHMYMHMHTHRYIHFHVQICVNTCTSYNRHKCTRINTHKITLTGTHATYKIYTQMHTQRQNKSASFFMWTSHFPKTTCSKVYFSLKSVSGMSVKFHFQTDSPIMTSEFLGETARKIRTKAQEGNRDGCSNKREILWREIRVPTYTAS